MSVTTTTHLNFRDSGREALDFCQSVFSEHAIALTYKDAGDVQGEKRGRLGGVGHVLADNGFHVMTHDVPLPGPYEQDAYPFFVSVRGQDTTEISTLRHELAAHSDV
ncbi:VOC family protein [Streptomyces sp. NPDC057325]|uniref:VOC family protein n=1 Tax=unclassified Streptomyces TaxID=2593676 RepID=UPI00363C262E